LSVPDLRGKSNSSSMIEYDISCDFFINALCRVEDLLFYSYFVECFYHERVFFEMILWFSTFCYVNLSSH
jgi:hypothetical protein